ncbi:MAG: hypothetical protein J6J03_06845, partial [Tyzzerella sp.]|nr:hypothetical protein [Tyzzerella sp.]
MQMSASRRQWKINITRIVEYAFAIVLLLDGNSVYHSLYNIDFQFPVICALLSVVLLMVYNRFRSLRVKESLCAAFMVLYACLYLLMNFKNTTLKTYLIMYVWGIPILFLVFCELERLGKRNVLLYR